MLRVLVSQNRATRRRRELATNSGAVGRFERASSEKASLPDARFLRASESNTKESCVV